MKKVIWGSIVLIFCVPLFGYVTNGVFRWNQKSDKVNIFKIDLSEKFKFSGEVNVIKLSKGALSYGVTNKNHRNYNFYMNANYFTTNNTPIGEVKINGKTIRNKTQYGGFFTSKGGSPSFYFNNRPNNVLHSSQTHTPLIKNGIPYSRMFKKKWAKYKLPRLVIGENKNGDIIVVHTIGTTGCSVSEFYQISKSLGMINALMFDGGASIEVGVNYGNINYKYQLHSDISRKLFNIPTPSVFIVGKII